MDIYKPLKRKKVMALTTFMKKEEETKRCFSWNADELPRFQRPDGQDCVAVGHCKFIFE